MCMVMCMVMYDDDVYDVHGDVYDVARFVCCMLCACALRHIHTCTPPAARITFLLFPHSYPNDPHPYIPPVYIRTLYTHYVHTMYTLCTHYIHTMYTLCTHYIHIIYTLYTHYVHTIYTLTHTHTLTVHAFVGLPGIKHQCTHYLQRTKGTIEGCL